MSANAPVKKISRWRYFHFAFFINEVAHAFSKQSAGKINARIYYFLLFLPIILPINEPISAPLSCRTTSTSWIKYATVIVRKTMTAVIILKTLSGINVTGDSAVSVARILSNVTISDSESKKTSNDNHIRLSCVNSALTASVPTG